MTIQPHLSADEVRAAHPGWLMWQLGTARWWAMHKATTKTLSADSLEELSTMLSEHGTERVAP